MPINNEKNSKKKAILIHKENILNELKYYDQRIDEARNEFNKTSSFEEVDSSDSEVEFPLLLEAGQSTAQLHRQQKELKTCLQATEELTGLDVLQAEVNMLANEPTVEGESPIKEAGAWCEVTADCRVDLVPFAISFYAHSGEHKFAPTSYRGLKVLPVKQAHEDELSGSVLTGLRRPSDAVEVLRSYAAAHRSRRSSLARLADKFGPALLMAPLPEGGYHLKCADVLEIRWTLQNKWSPIAPFHHKMKFDLDNLEETYIKRISQLYRQVSDPAVDTDERTLLLAAIVSTCMEAKPELDSSDAQEKDREVMAPPKTVPKKTKPKTKENAKDNQKSDLRASKRSIQDEVSNGNVKKLKVNENRGVNESKNTAEKDKIAIPKDNLKTNEKGDQKVDNSKNKESNNATSAKNKNDGPSKTNTKNDKVNKNEKSKNDEPVKSSTKNDEATTDVDKPGKSDQNNYKIAKTVKKSDKNGVASKKSTMNNDMDDVTTKKSDTNTKKDVVSNKKANKDTEINNAKKYDENNVAKVKKVIKETEKPKSTAKSDKNEETKKDDKPKEVTNKNAATKTAVKRKSLNKIGSNLEVPKKITRNSIGNVASTKNCLETINKPKTVATKQNNDKNAIKENTVRHAKENTVKTTTVVDSNSVSNSGKKIIKTVKNITNEKGEVLKTVVKKLSNPNTEVNKEKYIEKESTSANNNHKLPKDRFKNAKTVENPEKNLKKTVNTTKKPLKEQGNNMKPTTVKNINPTKPKIATNSVNSQKSSNMQNGNTEKENELQNKVSKIPQKKIASPKTVLKKAPLRVSPRKPMPKPKSPVVTGKKIIQKPVTNIPKKRCGRKKRRK